MAIISGLISLLLIVFIVALNKATKRDIETEERLKREEYYEKILNKTKE